MKKFLIVVVIFLFSILIITYFTNPFAAPNNTFKEDVVIIDPDHNDAVSLKLQELGFVKSFFAFNFVLSIKGNKIEPGGYYLSKNMDAWQIVGELNQGPDLKWVLIPEGLRKEQIGERLKEVLEWNNDELEKWSNAYATLGTDFIEGVYFPDKYLIPVDEDGAEVAKRMIRNFNEKFAPYFDKFAEKNIKWSTAIKIASIIEREAAGPNDMPIIAGIIWNRLSENQKLDIDATIQYAIGKRNGNWWSPVTGSDIKTNNSPFNTYKISGLPPHPISNPGLTAIEAVLNPKPTDCFYYLHDKSREIHCSKTYEKHLDNIDKYLR